MTRSPLLRLTVEECKALARSRFGLAGAALLLLLMLALTLGTWVSNGSPAPVLGTTHALLPTMLIPIAAWQVAHARSSRFLQAVFTTPVTAAQYFVARVVAVLLLGFLLVGSVLPYYAVHALHAQLPPEAWRLLAVGVGNVVACTALGTLVGVLVTPKGAMAPLGVGIALAVLSVTGLLLIPDLLAADPSLMRDVALRALHLSPPHLIAAAVGAHPLLVSDAPVLAGVAAVLLVALALGVAFWIFTRLQGPEGWEIPGRGAGVALGLAVALVAVAPAALADMGYSEATQTYGGGDNGMGSNVTGALVTPGTGAQVWSAPGWTHGMRPVSREIQLDLLVALHPSWLEPQPGADATLARVSNLTFTLEGPRVRVLEGARITLAIPPTERTWSTGDASVMPIPVVRVPVRLVLEEPTQLRSEVYMLWLNATYGFGNATLSGEDTLLVNSHAPGVDAQMALAGAPAPLACLALFARRSWRLRR